MDQDRESKVERGSEKLGLNLTWDPIESAQVPSPPKRKMAEDGILCNDQGSEVECGCQELGLHLIWSNQDL